jgi:hypothetical protein
MVLLRQPQAQLVTLRQLTPRVQHIVGRGVY